MESAGVGAVEEVAEGSAGIYAIGGKWASSTGLAGNACAHEAVASVPIVQLLALIANATT